MNNNIIELNLGQFLMTYLLLIIVLLIMKKCKIDKTKLLLVANIKMTIQLILAGLILTYIFNTPNMIFTLIYLFSMISFTAYRVLSKNSNLNTKFKRIVILSISLPSIFIIVFFVKCVVGETIFNPQYVIPISGMILGNTMTGLTLGLKTFQELLNEQDFKINALLCVGASPDTILLPFAKQALETAMLPTLNSMIGMGIVSLPGMMTGQILSGTLPMTAILYQIAIMVSICTVVTMSCFIALYFGCRTLYDKKTLIIDAF